MSKFKKISLILTFIILFGCIYITETYAVLSCNVNLNTTKKDVVQGEEFSVYVKISNLQTDRGIIAIGTVLKYNTDYLTLIDIEGQNKWSEPFYGKTSGKITSTKNALSKNNENVLKINFKAKDNVTKNAWIKINDFAISDGDIEENVGGDNITISIKEKIDSTQEENKQNNNTQNNGENNQNKPSSGASTNNNGTKPNTGTTSKPSPTTNKGNISNKKVETNTIKNTVDVNTEINNIDENIVNENIVINENIEQNNSVQNIFEEEQNLEKTKKDNKKELVYAACIFGTIAIIIIVFYIVKYLRILKSKK